MLDDDLATERDAREIGEDQFQTELDEAIADRDDAIKRAEAAEERERRLAEIVRARQWVARGQFLPSYCPHCFGSPARGHLANCRAGDDLAAHDAAQAGGSSS